MKRLCCTLILLTLLGGCSSMSVQTDFAPDVDFSDFETFQYKESDKSFARTSPLSDRRIVEAIRREAAASGLTEVDSDPDVYVTYYGSTDEQLQFQTVYTGVGRGWGRWGGGISTASTRATTFTEGTLVIDVWDAGENELLWRSVVSDTLGDNPERNAERINRGVARAFERFPPS